MIFFHITLHPAVLILCINYDFHIQGIHNFIIIILSRIYKVTNQFNDLLPVGLLAQLLVEHCTGITEVKGLNPIQA